MFDPSKSPTFFSGRCWRSSGGHTPRRASTTAPHASHKAKRSDSGLHTWQLTGNHIHGAILNMAIQAIVQANLKSGPTCVSDILQCHWMPDVVFQAAARCACPRLRAAAGTHGSAGRERAAPGGHLSRWRRASGSSCAGVRARGSSCRSAAMWGYLAAAAAAATAGDAPSTACLFFPSSTLWYSRILNGLPSAPGHRGLETVCRCHAIGGSLSPGR